MTLQGLLGTIYNPSPGRPSAREVVQIRGTVRARCKYSLYVPKGSTLQGFPLGGSPALYTRFASKWAVTVLWWATIDESCLYTKARVLSKELQNTKPFQPMLRFGLLRSKGALVSTWQQQLPKWIKSALLLPNLQQVIAKMLNVFPNMEPT